MTNGKIRFGLSKFPLVVPEGFAEESSKIAFVSHDVNLDEWEIPQKFDDSDFKGLKFSKKALIDPRGAKDEFF